ncbi:GNAT family N-acetyltransferase [Oceanicaulis sp. MMSF_3324]|uniref:GNAT family N-acetyltransferase n=1 Tax=Oceanicaulis sp. MMSF_3324 TaxID=3046702 RepID=UPI00273DF0BD|nr:GNAT family N-acetyltransferase [Oceanicaulis sp. MMSF_3324]
MAEFTITEERTDSKGRYIASAPGKPDAELTYSIASAHLIIIDHTGVPDDWRGQGVGKALVQRAVEDARARKIQIVPLCPFAKAQIEKTPDWQDVLNPAQ